MDKASFGVKAIYKHSQKIPSSTSAFVKIMFSPGFFFERYSLHNSIEDVSRFTLLSHDIHLFCSSTSHLKEAHFPPYTSSSEHQLYFVSTCKTGSEKVARPTL